MTLVVDASVVALWVLEQEGSDRAVALRHEDGLIAPSLIAAEVGSALWKAARRGDVGKADALAALAAALLPIDRLVPMVELHARALELALGLGHPVYDCFYLALAEREGVPLVSADTTLLEKGKQAKVKIRML